VQVIPGSTLSFSASDYRVFPTANFARTGIPFPNRSMGQDVGSRKSITQGRTLNMRLLTTAGIGVLSLLLGIPAMSAQDDAKPKADESRPETSPDTAKPSKQAPANEDKQEMKQDQNNPPKDDKQTKEEKKEDKDAAKAAKENGAAPGGTQPNAHPANGQSTNGQAANAQSANAHTANGQSARIPDKDFKAHFGRQHTLVINQPVIVQGQPRFQYSGYWFVISDPWPVGWAYTDSCYIDYIDGEYFLFDLLHPGVQIALVVVVA
jgi:hypothetical protein